MSIQIFFLIQATYSLLYIDIYTYIQSWYTYTSVYICIIYIHVYMYIHMFICTYIHVYIYIYILYTYICRYTYVHILFMYIYTYMYMYIYIYICSSCDICCNTPTYDRTRWWSGASCLDTVTQATVLSDGAELHASIHRCHMLHHPILWQYSLVEWYSLMEWCSMLGYTGVWARWWSGASCVDVQVAYVYW